MFKKISEAYAVLSNPKRRKMYDMYGQMNDEDQGDDDMDGLGKFMNMFGMGDIFGKKKFKGEEFDIDEFENFMKHLEKDNLRGLNQLSRQINRMRKNIKPHGNSRRPLRVRVQLKYNRKR